MFLKIIIVSKICLNISHVTDIKGLGNKNQKTKISEHDQCDI